jgi:16S rRNA processing protein RimM
MAPTQGQEANHSEPELIRVGYVIGAHGVRGAIRVRLDNPDSALLQCVERLTLAQKGERAEYRVTSAQSAGRGTFKVTLDGVAGADHAVALRGAIVMVAAAALPPTTAREFYYFEAIGCEVVTTKGFRVGIIKEIFSNGANDVWVVRDQSLEHLVPVIEDIVKEIDLAARRVIIEAVPGLLD